MFPIWKYGSEEQKQEWLPRMAAGEAIGCFGLTEPDHGSDPSSMRTHAKRNGRAGPVRLQDVDHQRVDRRRRRGLGPAPRTASAASWSRRGTRGFTTRDIHEKLSLRASVTSELYFDDVRAARRRGPARRTGLKGPLSCLSEARFGILWGVIGAARACFEAAVEYSRTACSSARRSAASS